MPLPIPLTQYYAGGQQIDTRTDGDLYYLLGDHFGSTTIVADDEGNEVGYVLYDPFGEVLEESTLLDNVTDRLFTGQRYDATIGLYDYNARFTMLWHRPIPNWANSPNPTLSSPSYTTPSP